MNKFKTKTNDTESLFFNVENDVFPRKCFLLKRTCLCFRNENFLILFLVIAAKLQSRTYLTALMPRDQVYDEEEDMVLPPTKKPKNDKELLDMEDDDEENNSKSETETIDNPYLRPVKMCPKWNNQSKTA